MPKTNKKGKKDKSRRRKLPLHAGEFLDEYPVNGADFEDNYKLVSLVAVVFAIMISAWWALLTADIFTTKTTHLGPGSCTAACLRGYYVLGSSVYGVAFAAFFTQWTWRTAKAIRAAGTRGSFVRELYRLGIALIIFIAMTLAACAGTDYYFMLDPQWLYLGPALILSWFLTALGVLLYKVADEDEKFRNRKWKLG